MSLVGCCATVAERKRRTLSSEFRHMNPRFLQMVQVCQQQAERVRGSQALETTKMLGISFSEIAHRLRTAGYSSLDDIVQDVGSSCQAAAEQYSERDPGDTSDPVLGEALASLPCPTCLKQRSLTGSKKVR